LPRTCLIHAVLIAALAASLRSSAVTRGNEPASTPPPAPPRAIVNVIHVKDPQADQWLKRIEHKSRDVKTLAANLRYDRNNGLTGSKQRRFGMLQYTAGPPARFAIYFDRLLTGRRPVQQNRWYVYDGQWLVEKQEDQKLFVKHRVAVPDPANPGRHRDPLALGEGPFPVPVGQRREEIVKRFNVRVMAPTEEDPANTVRLRLEPKPGHRIDFTYIDLWYDRDTLLPRRVYAVDHDSQDEMVVDLSEMTINTPIAAAVFDTTAPSERGERGWREEINP